MNDYKGQRTKSDLMESLVSDAIVSTVRKTGNNTLEYQCEHDVMQRILDETIAKYKIKGHRAKAFAFSFWLGCSPKTKQIL